MAVLSRDDLMNSIKAKFADDTSDDTLALIENVSDTINDLETKASDEIDWHKKFEENDKQWREKYKDRFFSTPVQQTEPETEAEDEKPKPKTFEDLFTTERGK